MINYPAKLAVIAADIITVDADPHPLVYLNAFDILKIERQGRGFLFTEVRKVDEAGTKSGRLLSGLAAELDSDTSLVGHRLDRLIDGLVRVPCGDPRDAQCKPALLRIQAALANEVVDVAWHDRDGLRSLEQLAHDYDLPAEWHRKGRQVGPNMLERELSAKAQCAWLAIAHASLTPIELRRALADYDQWRTANAIA